MEQLTKHSLNEDIRMFTIAHLNHVPVLSELASETQSNFKSFLNYFLARFSLQDQIDQKINFCLQYLRKRKNDKIYFIGHSIGALMCLK